MQRCTYLLIVFLVFLLLLSIIYSSGAIEIPYIAILFGHGSHRSHMISFYISCSMITATFIALIWSLIRFRNLERAGAENFHKHFGMEIFWTIIPFLILVLLMIPTIMTQVNS